MKYRLLLAIATLTIAAQTSATPAMSIVTVNSEDPLAYLEWAKKSGPVIGNAINAMEGGVCVAEAGFYGPGEAYYWHTFNSHATAVGVSVYNESITKEVKRLKVKRTISRADSLSLVMAEELVSEVGESFSTWNLIISTEDRGLYKQQLERINDVATERGFGDVSLAAYSYLTGENAGDLLVIVRGPSDQRLGLFLDQLGSDWMSPIMAGLASIRDYKRGFIMTCTVTYIAGD